MEQKTKKDQEPAPLPHAGASVAEKTAEKAGTKHKDSAKKEGAEAAGTGRKVNPATVRKIVIPCAAVAAVALILLSVFLVMKERYRECRSVMPAFLAKTGFLQKEDFRYPTGVKVNDIDIGKKSVQQAKELLEDSLKDLKIEYHITVKVGEESIDLNQDDFRFTYESDQILNTVKEDCISVMLGKTPKGDWNYRVPATMEQQSAEEAAQKVSDALHRDPVDATILGVGGGKMNFSDDVPGYQVNTQALIPEFDRAVRAALEENVREATIEAPTEEIEASVKKSDLEKRIVKLASHSTVSYNTAAANSNMKKSLAMCNGSVIAPGATWSFNACTGDSNRKSAGWLPSDVYIGGKVATGVGGGICQTSTTIYNAALKANLGIAERHAHAWPAGYATRGFDATVDYPNLDLKLKNNTPYPVYLECYMSGTTLYTNIYGYHSEDYDKITLDHWETTRVEGEYFLEASSRTLWKNGQSVRVDSLPISKYSLKPKERVPDPEDESSSEESSSESESSQESSSAETSPASENP